MKIAHLVDLLRAAELGCSAIEDTAFKSNVTVALATGMEELARRFAARKLYKKTRPAQTTTRKLIRQQLRLAYSGVRLTRAGQWLVQPEPGLSWQLFARDDSEAQELLVFDKPQRQACGCRFKHSDAAGVIEACLLGQEQGADEYWTGY